MYISMCLYIVITMIHWVLSLFVSFIKHYTIVILSHIDVLDIGNQIKKSEKYNHNGIDMVAGWISACKETQHSNISTPGASSSDIKKICR